MTHFVLHIGTHKTGSTAIQQALAENREALLAQGVDFPVLGRTAEGAQAHRHLAAWVRGQPERHPPDFPAALARGISAAGTCILSAEALYFCHAPQHLDRIESVCPGASVICYLREPVGHLLSMFREAAKNPVPVSLPAFVAQHIRGLGGDRFGYYAYDRNIAFWQSRFAVTAVPYPASGVVDDFRARMRLDALPAPQKAAPRVNAALSDEAVLLMLAITRGLREGLIDMGHWRALKKAILTREAAGALPDLGRHKVERVLDMRPFLAAFRSANERFRGLADGSAEDLTYVDTEELDHVRLLAMAREAIGGDARRPRDVGETA